MSGEEIVIALGYGVAGIWLLMIMARLQGAWGKATSETGNLQVALRNAEQRLKREQEAVKKVEEEVKKTQAQMTTEKQEQDSRREALANAVPPPADEIRVLSEFPTSPKDTPWVAQFQRLDGAAARAGDPDQHWVLFWSANHTAAVQRAAQLISQKASYGVVGVRRFGD